MEQVRKKADIKKVKNQTREKDNQREKNKRQSKEEFAGLYIFVGIDVHKKSWHVTIYVEDVLYKSYSMSPPSSKQLISYLKDNFPGGEFYLVYEAGFSGYGLYDDAKEAGMECIVVSPADVPMSNKNKKFKTDSHDSKNLAKQYKSGLLEGIYVPDAELREYRALVRLRNKLVKDRTRIKNYTKSNLMFFGKEILEEDGDNITSWSRKYFHLLSELQYRTDTGSKVIERLKDTTQYYNEQIIRVDKEILELSKHPIFAEDVKILRSVPGISTLTAMVILVEIGDFSRFEDTHKLKSYVGLIPEEHSSGETEIKSGITKRGNKFLKRVIIEASWVAIRKDKTLLKKYTKATKRMRGSKAIILVAGSLLSRIRSIMRQRVLYRVAV